MKSPSAAATREALNAIDDQGSDFVWPWNDLINAARFAVSILPDADGEWPDEVVEGIAEIIWTRQWPGGKPWNEIEISQPMFQDHAKAVLAELARLAEGSGDGD